MDTGGIVRSLCDITSFQEFLDCLLTHKGNIEIPTSIPHVYSRAEIVLSDIHPISPFLSMLHVS